MKSVGLEDRTATRDLTRLAETGLLESRGERRGRHYMAGERLMAIRRDLRSVRTALIDPYPTLPDEIRRAR